MSILLIHYLSSGYKAYGGYDPSYPMIVTINFNKASPAEIENIEKKIKEGHKDDVPFAALTPDLLEVYASKYGVTIVDGAHRRYATFTRINVSIRRPCILTHGYSHTF
jgi:hypothetical protein